MLPTSKPIVYRFFFFVAVKVWLKGNAGRDAREDFLCVRSDYRYDCPASSRAISAVIAATSDSAIR